MIVGKRTWLAGLMILGLVLGGCSGEDAGVGGYGAGTPDTIRSSSGDSGNGDAQAGSSTQLPEVEGMPIPLPTSAGAITTPEAGPLQIVQFIVPLDQQEATIAFYDDWTGSQSEDYLRTEAESGGVSWQNTPEAGEEKLIISVLSPIEGDDFVAVTLSAGPAE